MYSSVDRNHNIVYFREHSVSNAISSVWKSTWRPLTEFKWSVVCVTRKKQFTKLNSSYCQSEAHNCLVVSQNCLEICLKNNFLKDTKDQFPSFKERLVVAVSISKSSAWYPLGVRWRLRLLQWPSVWRSNRVCPFMTSQLQSSDYIWNSNYHQSIHTVIYMTSLNICNNNKEGGKTTRGWDDSVLSRMYCPSCVALP